MNFILIGYMASGKSKIGVELAKVLSFEYLDLDDIIEKNEKNDINSIFKKQGELYFRKKEKEYLNKVLNTQENTIVSLGGGTPCYFNTMDDLLMHDNATSIYLKVNIPVLVDRLKEEKAKRPLIAHIETEDLLTEFIGKHLFERSAYYSKADYIINANGKVDEIVEDIVAKLF